AQPRRPTRHRSLATPTLLRTLRPPHRTITVQTAADPVARSSPPAHRPTTAEGTHAEARRMPQEACAQAVGQQCRRSVEVRHAAPIPLAAFAPSFKRTATNRWATEGRRRRTRFGALLHSARQTLADGKRPSGVRSV